MTIIKDTTNNASLCLKVSVRKSVGFLFAMLSPAHTAIEKKTSEKESIVPAKRATLPLAREGIHLKIPIAKRMIGIILLLLLLF